MAQTYIFEDYILTNKIIGQGNYGKVYLAYSNSTFTRIAVKLMMKTSFNDEEIIQLRREIEISLKLTHPNIIHTYGYKETTDKIYIFLEYCPNGDLCENLLKRTRFTENETL